MGHIVSSTGRPTLTSATASLAVLQLAKAALHDKLCTEEAYPSFVDYALEVGNSYNKSFKIDELVSNIEKIISQYKFVVPRKIP